MVLLELIQAVRGPVYAPSGKRAQFQRAKRSTGQGKADPAAHPRVRSAGQAYAEQTFFSRPVHRSSLAFPSSSESSLPVSLRPTP